MHSIVAMKDFCVCVCGGGGGGGGGGKITFVMNFAFHPSSA